MARPAPARTPHGAETPASVALVVPGGGGAAACRAGAERLARGLRAAGLAARVLDGSGLQALAPPSGPAVVHALSAMECGAQAVGWARGQPVLWTMTNTDVAREAVTPLEPLLRQVRALIVPHEQALAQARALFPAAALPMRIIAPGIPLPRAVRGDGRKRGPWPIRRRGEVVLLLPSGLDPGKDPDLAVAVLDHVRRAGVAARLWIAGPERDRPFAAAFLDSIAGRPFVQYLGDVPPAAMIALYRRADIVLNTSRAEGLSEPLLQAMAAGRPVLATDIPGNRAAVRSGRDGLLAPPREMPGTALGLAQAPHVRRRLGHSAPRSVRQRFDPRVEVQAHLRLYRDVWASREH